MGKAKTCSEIVSTTSIWGGTAIGISFTNSGYGSVDQNALAWIGCTSITAQSCPLNSFYCNDNVDGIQFGTTGTLRALYGKYKSADEYPSSHISCASSTNTDDTSNAPEYYISALRICNELGYKDGQVTRVASNSCPDVRWNDITSVWEQDFVGSGYGQIFTCTMGCNAADDNGGKYLYKYINILNTYTLTNDCFVEIEKTTQIFR